MHFFGRTGRGRWWHRLSTTCAMRGLCRAEIVDDLQNARRKQMLFQQMPVIHHRGVLWGRGAECQPCRLAHRGDLLQRFFHGWIASEINIAEVDAQHGFQWIGLPTAVSFWMMRFAMQPVHATARPVSSQPGNVRDVFAEHGETDQVVCALKSVVGAPALVGGGASVKNVTRALPWFLNNQHMKNKLF